MKSVNQTVTGNKNIVVNGEYKVTNYNVMNNIELSEFRAFEKVLFSVSPERFLEDILQPYLDNVLPGVSINEFKKMLALENS